MKTPRRARLRGSVFQRDRGACSACGLDTERLRLDLEAAERLDLAAAFLECLACADAPCPPGCGAGVRKRVPWTNRNDAIHLAVTLWGYTPDELRRSPLVLWEADHAVPLSESGGDNLDNLRTLCRPCHRAATAALATRRARREYLRQRCRTCAAIGGDCAKHRVD